MGLKGWIGLAVALLTALPPCGLCQVSLPERGITTDRLDLIQRYGFSRFPRGAAPFGHDASGNPVWPLLESLPPPARTASEFVAGWPGLVGKNVMQILELMNCSPQPINIDMARFQALLKPIQTDQDPNPTLRARPRVSSQLSAGDLERFRTAFLRDCIRHARAVSEGDDTLAMELSTIWQHVGIAHPDQMEEITLNGSAVAGYPNFETWMDSSAIADWQALGMTDAPPVLLSSTPPTPPAPLPLPVAPATPGVSTPKSVADAIFSQMDIWGNLTAAQLDTLADDLDLEGPGAKQPMLDIIQDLAGTPMVDTNGDGLIDKQDVSGQKQALKDVLVDSGDDTAQALSDKIKTRLETEWGTALPPDKAACVRDLAERVIRRLENEVDLQLGP